MTIIQSIWHKLYPADHEHKWMPLMWLPFMIWFFLDPYWKHAGWWHWTWNTAAGLFFVILYLQAFSRPGRIRNTSIVLMVVMAAIFIPLNSGSAGLLIYAAAAGGFNTKLRSVITLLVVEIAILLFYAARLHFD